MNIGIIGGGFYGCYFASKLAKKHKVSIFEINKNLIEESGRNNQYRLHQGFHYPRSEETIIQTKIGYDKFISEFKKYIYFPKENYYCIHKNSKIDFETYLKIIKRNKLSYKITDINQIPFLKKENFLGSVNTNEGVILVKKINNKLISEVKKNCRVYNNTEVFNIDSTVGNIETKNCKYKFDKIINTTYVNPNLGLKKKYIDTKYELASILIPNNKINNVPGITIMDGNFISVYPRSKNTFSLTSVKFTPVVKFNNINKKDYFLKKFCNKKEIKKIKNSIFDHVKEFVDFPVIIDSNKSKIEFAIKTKIKKDINDIRTAKLITENKIISVLCGKLDAAPVIFEKMKKYI